MKRTLSLLLAAGLTIFLSACGEKSPSTEMPGEESTTKEVNTSGTITVNSIEELEASVSKDVEATILSLNTEWEALSAEIDVYEKYKDNAGKVEEFYAKIQGETQQLCIRLREYSLTSAKLITASNKAHDEKYDDFDIIYDSIYEDARDKVYDEIYDGILDEMYDAFYDGILEDAYDIEPYAQASDTRSDAYDIWSDTRSEVYDIWSDAGSDIYDFWSDMRSEMWENDMEKAAEIIQDFQEDIQQLKS